MATAPLTKPRNHALFYSCFNVDSGDSIRHAMPFKPGAGISDVSIYVMNDSREFAFS
jgi:hypothetical protein